MNRQSPSPNVSSVDGKLRWDQGKGLIKLDASTIGVTPPSDGGSADDIQKAINYLNNLGGGTVLIRNGTHYPSTDITVPNDINIVGETPAAAIVDFGGVSHGFRVVGTNGYNTGTISATNRSTTITGSGTAWTSAMIGRTIIFQGVFYGITAVGGATTLTIDTPYERSTQSGIAYGIATAADNVLLSNFTIQNSTAQTLSGAIFMQYAINCKVDTVTMLGTGVGIYCYICSTSTLSGFSSIGCTIGVYAETCGSWTINDYFALECGVNLSLLDMVSCSINNATVSSATGNGLTMSNCKDIGLYDHTFTTNGDKGIELISCSDIEIFGLTCRLSTSDGIKLTSGNLRVGIQNVTLANNTGYGINIAAASNIKNSVVMNFYSGNTAGTLNDLGTTTVNANNQT